MQSMLDGDVSYREKSRIGVTVLNWMVITLIGIIWAETQGARRQCCRYLEKVFGRKTCKCKGPEARTCFVC